jgi:hypothetical protein
MNLKKTSLSIVTIVISSLLLGSSVSAWLVPGTIQKWDGTSNIQQCKKENGISYKTSFSCVDTTTCDEYNQIEDKCIVFNEATCEEYASEVMQNCKNSKTWVEWHVTFEESCSDTLWWNWWPAPGTTTVIDYTNCTKYKDDATCKTWSYKNGTCKGMIQEPSFTNSTYYDYNYTESNYTFWGLYTAGSNRILWNDSWKTCFISANWSNKTKPTTLKTTTCDINNSTYYSKKWLSWTCHTYAWKNTYLDTYDQLWNTSFLDNKNTSGQKTCVIQWRYAQIDDTKPTIDIEYGSFKEDTDKDQWCNLNKYKGESPFNATYWDLVNNVATPGCDFYKWDNVISDLVDSFEIIVQDSQSGLSSVSVELWTCWGTYDINGSLTDLINDINSASGVRTWFLLPLIIKSWEESSYAWGKIVSLKTLFWNKTSLDECLVEWENYLKVVATDAARSDLDWKTLDGNSNEEYNTAFAIRIDNSGPTFVANSPLYTSWNWSNRTIDGTFEITDNIWSSEILCTTYEKKSIWGQCSDTVVLPIGGTWNNPVRVDGTYDIYQCEGIDITNASICTYTLAPPDPFSRDTSWNYENCDGSKEYKTVTCANAGWDLDTTKCIESDLTSGFDGDKDEEIKERDSDNVSYTLQRSCTVLPTCFTLWTSVLGWTDTLCSN